MDYDVERKRQEESELRKAFRELFPLAFEHDLPSAPCHIKRFLRNLITEEAANRLFFLQSRVAHILCEISPPKTHIEDMCRIVVEEAKRGRQDRLALERAAETKAERDELLQRITEIGMLVGCNHINDPDGRQKLVQCVENALEDTEEKRRRVYYQDIVYHVCNAMKRFYPTETVCGTAEQPSTHLQERLQELLNLAWGHTIRQQTVKFAERGDIGVWVWGGDGDDHPESLTCPILISAEQMRELLAKIPNSDEQVITSMREAR